MSGGPEGICVEGEEEFVLVVILGRKVSYMI